MDAERPRRYPPVKSPFRWQAGKVWQGTGSAVRLPPRSWWILASRPSAPWLLTGIPDGTGPLSSCSTLPGPSVLPFQARAPSSLSTSFAFRPPYRTFLCRAQPAPNAAPISSSSSGVPALAMTWAQEMLAKAPPSVPCSCSWILTMGDGAPIPQPLFNTPPALRLS